MSEITIQRLGPDTAALLDQIAEDVFDGPVEPAFLAQFLASSDHVMMLALADGQVVGMASGVIFLHPDKAPQMWINEVGVGPEYQRRGIATRLVGAMRDEALARGCTSAWLLTETDNIPARALYRSLHAGEETGVVYYDWALTPEG